MQITRMQFPRMQINLPNRIEVLRAFESFHLEGSRSSANWRSLKRHTLHRRPVIVEIQWSAWFNRVVSHNLWVPRLSQLDSVNLLICFNLPWIFEMTHFKWATCFTSSRLSRRLTRKFWVEFFSSRIGPDFRLRPKKISADSFQSLKFSEIASMKSFQQNSPHRE